MSKPALARYSYRADSAVPAFPDDRPLVVFDGNCMLCSRGAESLLKLDQRGVFRMTVAQSALGQALYRHYGLNGTKFDTYLLIDSGVLYVKSDATVRIFARLPFPHSLAGFLRFVPRTLRDAIYHGIARRRLRWFGVRQSCFVPNERERERFVN